MERQNSLLKADYSVNSSKALKMNDYREEWRRSRDDLVYTLKSLGFPEELGNVIASHLGSPKAIDRMTSYLRNVKPKKTELVVDEMLVIRTSAVLRRIMMEINSFWS